MRWLPTGDRCGECGFDWTIPSDDAIDICSDAEPLVRIAMGEDTSTGGVDRMLWTKSMYVWHLVDALGISAERLLTASLAPDYEIPCWDENKMADVRHYGALPVAVGMAVLGPSADQWTRIARRRGHPS